MEVVPFDKQTVETDARVHLLEGGIDMKTALGPTMKREGPVCVKISDG